MKPAILAVIVFIAFAGLVFISGKQNANRCEMLEREVRQEIDQVRYCEQDNDCRIVELGCPFSCAEVVNRSHMQNVLHEYSRYSKECMMFCGKCEQEQRLARCLEGACVLS